MLFSSVMHRFLNRWRGLAVIALSLGVLAVFIHLNTAPSAVAAEKPNSAPSEPTSAPSKLKDVDMAELMKPGTLPDHVLGKSDAPYTIVEYSSLTCSHCAHFHKDVLPELKKKYIDTGKAKYILREFPIDRLAAAGFLIARCAEKNKYFDAIELLYGQQEKWAFADNPLAGLEELAKQVGIDKDRVKQCLTDENTLQYILWVRERASKEFNVHATPTFFVNGKPVRNENTIEQFDKIIENNKAK
jgi:protein-disulfide isomerase